MKRGAWAENLELIRDAAVDDIIHARELMQLGVPEGTIYRWCRDRGRWTLMAPATVRLSTGTATRHQLVRTALVYAGPRAVVTGLDAARAHGLRRGVLPDPVHLLIPADLHVHGTPTIRIERTKRLPEPLLRDGLPVAPVERCVLDAVRRMSGRSEIAAILTEPVQRRMLLPQALRQELDAGCRRGSAVPRAILRAVGAGARSAAEVDLYHWWFAHDDLPREIVFNVRIRGAAGPLGIADAFLPDAGLVLPVDSVEHHFMTPEQVEDTERQHRAYRSAGLHVHGFRPSRMRSDSVGLHRDVLDAIAVAEKLPQPAVSWSTDLPASA